MARATSGTMVSGSSIYAYVEVDGITHHSNRTTMNVRGGVTSGYYWDINCESRGKWWEGGTTHDATDWSGSQHYGGYGDLQLLSTTYTFDRYSYNRTVSAGCESWCSLGSATAWIDDITIPALPPSATTLTATRDSDNKVSLSWTNGGGVKQAVCIERQVDGGAWGEIQVVWNGSATSWADTTTSAGHSYSYRFRYYNVNAYGSYSNVETVTMTPSAPTSITTAAISGSTNVSVTLENTSAVATSLEYQVSTDGGSTWSASTTVSGSPVTSFTATGISGTALIRVRNANSTGTSSWLVSDSVTTICPPNPPTLTAPTGNVLDLAAGNVTFEWVHNALDGSAQSAAQIDYSTNGGSTWTSITGITTAQSYTMAIPWSAGTTVTWRARTKGADASYSDWSAANTFNVYTAPTLSITSPGATITGMPISLAAAYYDMAGYSCVAATVSLQKDGRTLYTEAGTISEVGGVTYITSSLDVSGFLPTNGESYTVVVTARSSSSLQTSANATFLVDFVEPQAGELNISNDPETGYASLLATFDNSASEITYTGSTNTQYESTEGYVRSLTVEGKSAKWNQLYRRTSESGSGTNYSYTVSNGKVTLTTTATATTSGSNDLAFYGSEFTAGHKYLFLCSGDSRISLYLKTYGVGSGNILSVETPSYNNCAFVFTNLPAGTYVFYPQLIDLTAMYGAGNEPTTLTDPRIAWLKAYALAHPAYDAGSLVSIEGAGVVGRNLLEGCEGEATGSFPYGHNYNTNPLYLPYVIPAGTQLTFSFEVLNEVNAQCGIIPLFTDGTSLGSKYTPTGWTTGRKSSTFSWDKDVKAVGFYTSDSTTRVKEYQLEIGSTAHAYEPYSLTTITTTIRSAGSVHDQLQADADSWTVERRVGVVDLGTLTWSYDNNRARSYDLATLAKMPAQQSDMPNFTCSTKRPIPYSAGLANNHDGIAIDNAAKQLICYAADSSDLPTGTLYYELATPTQEPETSISPIEIGSAFAVATDLDSTFEMTTWDGSADAVSISVSRVNPDGTITPLLTDGASGSGFVDRYAPLNTPYQYAVTTKAASQAVKTVYVDNIFGSPRAFFYYDDEIVAAMWNQSYNHGYTRPEQEELRFSGRTLPVLVDDKALAVSGSASFTLLSRAEAESFKRLMRHSGSVIYKPTDGNIIHARVSVGFSRTIDTVSFYQQQITVNYTQVDGVML